MKDDLEPIDQLDVAEALRDVTDELIADAQEGRHVFRVNWQDCFDDRDVYARYARELEARGFRIVRER